MSKLIMCHVLHTYLTPNCFFLGVFCGWMIHPTAKVKK